MVKFLLMSVGIIILFLNQLTNPLWMLVRKELLEGMISVAEAKPTCIHSLGAVPKAGGGMRPITDCSRPQGQSVNNYCSSLIREFSYKSVDDVAGMLVEGDFMSVIDIKAAYRAVPIRECHRKFMGFKWELDGEELTFVDNRMCFGHKLGPSYFDTISSFIYDSVVHLSGIRLVNYLDDFIVIAESYDQCIVAQSTVTQLLRFLGFHVSFSKVSSPSTSCTYLGIEIDSKSMELRLPKNKLYRKTISFVIPATEEDCRVRTSLGRYENLARYLPKKEATPCSDGFNFVMLQHLLAGVHCYSFNLPTTLGGTSIDPVTK